MRLGVSPAIEAAKIQAALRSVGTMMLTVASAAGESSEAARLKKASGVSAPSWRAVARDS
jgi:hypothetical protein